MKKINMLLAVIVISLCLVGNVAGEAQIYNLRINAAKEAAKKKILEENSAVMSASEKECADECRSIMKGYYEELSREDRKSFSLSKFWPLAGAQRLDATQAKEKECWARCNEKKRANEKALAEKIAASKNEAEKKVLAEIVLEEKAVAERERAAAELEKIAAASPERVAAAKDRSLRKNYAAYLEESFLKEGMSVEVSTYGEEDTFLGFRYILMTKSIAYSWTKKYREKAKSLGFQGMSFVAYISNHPTTQSYSYSIERKLLWRYWGGSEEGLYIE
ncbi:MAG: hypothetical protein L6300_03360 [Syntrophaceae bacterium]|nr:hypothetical protein [Syntrophaceae bacterium]